ncbi:MAG: baseplate J/gp47 family protein [Fusobacteriaceae bacterium]
MTVKQFYEIKNNILNNMGNSLSKIEGSYNYDIASAMAIEFDILYKEIEQLEKQLFPWSVTEDGYLDYHLAEFGLTRREAVPAQGIATIEGKPSAIIPKDSIAIGRTGVKYKTLENGIILSDGKCKVKIECLESGTVGNCGIGDIQVFEISVPDVYKVYNEEAIDSGYDIEPFKEAKIRMEEKARNPAHSGNIFDYTLWAKSVEGVGRVSVFPIWNGPGTVKVLISDYSLQPASTELVDNTKIYIENNRPVGADVTVNSFNSYNADITLNVRVVQGVITKDELENKIKELLTLSLQNEEFTSYNIFSTAKIGRMILDIEGVIDYDDLRINGALNNVDIGNESVVVLGEITVVGFNEN